MLTFHLSRRPSLSVSHSFSLSLSNYALLCAGAICSLLCFVLSYIFLYCHQQQNYLSIHWSAFTIYTPLSPPLTLSPSHCCCCYYLKGSGSVTASLGLCLPCETAATATSKGDEQRRARKEGGGACRCLAFTFCGLPQLSY